MYLCLFGLLFSSASYPGEDWDHFVFSQQWPMSVCIDSNLSVSFSVTFQGIPACLYDLSTLAIDTDVELIH